VNAFRRHLALLLVLVGLALTPAACSGSGGSDSGGDSGGGSDGGSAEYTNDQYGFTLTHDPQFTEGEPVDTPGAGGGSVFDVIFADTNGARVSDRYVDAIQVSVYELAREVEPSEVPELKGELDGVVEEMLGALSGATITEPLTEVTVNDAPGFKLAYTYTEDGTELTALTYFLFKGQREYQITTQAATENWSGLSARLEAAAESFSTI